MRRLVIGNAISTILLTIIILVSSIGAAELYAVSNSQPLVAHAATSRYFTMTGYPSSTIAGQTFSGVKVTVYNSNGQIDTSYNGKVYFTSTDPKATLPYTSQSYYKFTTGSKGDKGVHTFSGFNLVTVGSQTITITDGSISLTTSAIKVNPASATKITISPKTATITAGSNQAYTATATDYYGNSWDITSQTSWSITTGASGSWAANGIYTSKQSGTWTVTGSYSGLTDTASLTVTHATTASIVISPKTSAITAGSSQTYTVSAFDQYGNTWDATSSASWSISTNAQGICGGTWSNNICTSTKTGTWTVTVKVGTLSDTSLLTVTQGAVVGITIAPLNPSVVAGNNQAFTATATDVYGNTWDVSSSTMWLVDSGAHGTWNGNVYTSQTSGVWKITGIYGGCSASTYLTVGFGPIYSITITPKVSTIAAGSSEAFTAIAQDVFGNTLDVSTSASWSITSGANGQWSGAKYTAATSGQFIVMALYEGVSNTASITVTPGSPIKITVGSSSASATAGTSVTYTATAQDSLGNTWDVSSLAVWVSDSGAKGTWTLNTYTCAKMGTWKITGTYGGYSDTASLTVIPSSPTSITISEKNANVASGSAQSYSATATDSFQNSWDISKSATWSIDSNAGGSWSGNVYTAAKAGTWTVTGSLGTLSDTGSLVVTHGITAQIATNPTTASIAAGSSQTFTTTAYDSSGNSWDATTSATYIVDSQAGGLLSANLYTSANAGTWTVTTVCFSLQIVVFLTVTHASPASISVGPNSATVTAGSSQAYSATASDSFGNIWTVSSLTSWSISAGASGSWSSNVYTSATQGSWTITGTYSSLNDYAYLTVTHSSAIALSVTPKTATITTGSNEAFTTTATDAYNNVWDATDSTSWVIDSGAGGYWTNNIYSSVKAGTWTVTAVYSGESDTASLTVNHGTPLSITVSPPSSTLTAGSPQTFTATASDSNGNNWDVTSSTTWSIDSAAQGSWTGNTYNSYTAGTWTVLGSYSGITNTASVTVNHAPAASLTVGLTYASITAGSQEAFTATASDVYGNTWDVTSSTVWTVDSGAGGLLTNNIYTSATAGVWSITGTYGSLSKSVFLTVTHSSIESIQINPYDVSIAAGSNEAYSTTAMDSFGNTWDVTNSASYSASVGAGGSWTANVYTPATAGSWTITATMASLVATAPLTVTHGTAVSISVSPKTQTIQAGSSQTFAATATDQYGNSWDASNSIAWVIDSGACGSWLGNAYTSTNCGNWAVTAVLNGLTNKASLTVNPGSVVSITINPASTTIGAGSSQTYTATASDAQGNKWDITNLASWLASSEAGGTWTGNVYTPSNSGNWTVTASNNGVSANAQLNVNGEQPVQQFSPADFYKTGTVGSIDFFYFVDAYIQYYQNGAINPICDFNHDGKMDFQDISLFLIYYNAGLAALYGQPTNSPLPSPSP